MLLGISVYNVSRRNKQGGEIMVKQMHSIKGKILVMSILVLIISNVSIGLLGYSITRKELNKKGEVILQNAVEAANQLIHVAQHAVEDNAFTLEEAQEMVKEHLIGELQADGTRTIDSTMDLGDNGYLIVLDLEGNMIAHPTLEGQDAWEFRDKSKDETLFIQEGINKAKDGGGFTYYDWFLPNSETTARKIVYNQVNDDWGWVVTAGTYEMDFNESAMIVLKYTSIGILFFLVLVSISMYIFSHKVGRALELVTTRANNIANLDITEDVSQILINRKDEIGTLASSFQKIVDNLRSFVGQISNTSDNLATSSRELKYSSEQSALAANEVAQAISDIAEGATHQAIDTEKGAEDINELGMLVERNQDNIKELSISTKEVDALKDEGLKIIQELVRNTEASNVATMDIQNVIQNTNESAEKIEKAANMIKSIADQTNLLALNAAIEAARAGEVGRGFAVVADEIRKLAEQSNIFTEEIASIVNELSNNTNRAVVTMEEVTSITKLQSESVEETNKKFIGIAKSIEHVDSIIANVLTSEAEMVRKKDTIIELVQNLSAIAEENAAGTEEASASVEEQTATMTEIANSSEKLLDLATNMKESISKFKY